MVACALIWIDIVFFMKC